MPVVARVSLPSGLQVQRSSPSDGSQTVTLIPGWVSVKITPPTATNPQAKLDVLLCDADVVSLSGQIDLTNPSLSTKDDIDLELWGFKAFYGELSITVDSSGIHGDGDLTIMNKEVAGGTYSIPWNAFHFP